MNHYSVNPIDTLLSANSYPGRGIVVGTSQNSRYACCAYFIMGRSANSRNRVFAKKDGELFTEPFDISKVTDPSLIIYRALRQYKNKLILTNGDHTDTIYEGFISGKTFAESLAARLFEPDKPNFTPRISACLTFESGAFVYSMSILKSVDAFGTACARYFYNYPSVAGLGHFIHTYASNGDPLPPFAGEPERVTIPDSIDAFTETVWSSLDADNKISLYVRYTDIETLECEERIVNKNVR